MGKLDGKVALITGTGGGQGRAAALLFSAEGARVVGCDLREDDATETAAMARRQGGQMVSMAPVDLSDPVAAEAWVNEGVQAAGGLDILYNNAGSGRMGSITTTTVDDWAWSIANGLEPG